MAANPPNPPNPPAAQPQTRVYPAVYSGIGVYECMIRGIAVMRRRADSYVNATQILKVAGIDKGRRTKILEKEILPGKHEIVQGGYGKYQGTWIPLERGRDVANQFGIAGLLAPLFDHIPNHNIMTGPLPSQLGPTLRPPPGMPMPFPPNMRPGQPYMVHYMPAGMMTRPPMFPPGMYPQFPPGTAPRLPPGLQPLPPGMYPPQPLQPPPHVAPHPMPYPGLPGMPTLPIPPHLQVPPPAQSSPQPQKESRKRIREEEAQDNPRSNQSSQAADTSTVNGEAGPSGSQSQPNSGPPAKRPRVDPGPVNGIAKLAESPAPVPEEAPTTIDPKALRARSRLPRESSPAPIPSYEPSAEELHTRFFTRATVDRIELRTALPKSTKRPKILAAIQEGAVETVISLLLDHSDDCMRADINAVLDDKGHTVLHLAAALGKVALLEALIESGADVHRGNFGGETALMRAVTSPLNHETQTFLPVLTALRGTFRTMDVCKRTVLHHVAHVSGVKGHAASARFYMESILVWVEKHQGKSFTGLLDLKDESGDTALNISARVGSKVLVSMLRECGADAGIANKFGMKPRDFGVDVEENMMDLLVDTPITEPDVEGKKSDIIADMTKMIQELSVQMANSKKTQETRYTETKLKVVAATRQLTEHRKSTEEWKAKSEDLDRVNLRIRNLEQSASYPDVFDWTGRTNDLNAPSLAFVRRGPGSLFKDEPHRQSQANPVEGGTINPALTFGNGETTEEEPTQSLAVLPDAPLPRDSSIQTLIKLKRMKMWHARIDTLMRQQLKVLKNASAEKEMQYRKVVADCAGYPIDKVDESLNDLFLGLETDTSNIELPRMANLLQKIEQLPAMTA